MGHAGEPHADQGSDGNTVFWDAVLAVGLGNIDVIGIAAGVFFVLLAGFLLWTLKDREEVHLPHAVSLLLVVLSVAVLFLLLTVVAPVKERPERSFGPGMGPLHMEEFYTGFAPRNVQRLADFKDIPTVTDIVNDPGHVPPPIERNRSETVHITLEAEERIAELADGTFYYYWTYNGTVPGPILRVREGDTVVLTLKNEEQSTHNHSIDLHAVNGPGGGAVTTQVRPGGEETIRFKALNPGFYVYHCGTDNIPTHVANQMFGGIIVEPTEGLPPVDEQFAVFQGEIYTAGPMGATGFQPFDPEKLLQEEPTYYTFNGRPHGVTGEHALEAEVNDTVRIYFGNMGNAKVSSFHVIGEQFRRAWPHGTAGSWSANDDGRCRELDGR
ncbi:MAG: multicopper oxidase domain-containing protein [Candidatus Nanohaloarchaea archaeon]